MAIATGGTPWGSVTRMLADGPVGTGKTTSVMAGLILWSSSHTAGATYILLGASRDQVEQGSMAELHQLCPAIETSGYTMRVPSRLGEPNKILAMVAARQGDERKLKAINAAGGVVDEATLVPRAAISELTGRLRVGPHPRLVMATNPSGPGHWLYKMIRRPRPGDMRVRSTHADNPGLPAGFLENLRKTYPDGHLARRMIDGEWVAAMGLVFPFLCRELEQGEGYEPDPQRVIGLDIGLDVGYSSVSHAVYLAREDTGIAWVVGEWRYDHQRAGPLSDDQIIGGVYDHARQLGYGPVLTITIDRSAISTIAAAQQARVDRWGVYSAYDCHESGVAIVESWTARGGLRVVPGAAPVMMEEAATVAWDERSRLDVIDTSAERHGLDALRYAVATRHVRETGGVKAWERRRTVAIPL